MKIRVGYGLGTTSQTNDQDRFLDLVDALEEFRFDSLWLSERLTSDCPDPLVGMAMAAARTTRLKVGMSVMVLPGRNPVVLAKSLASLDRLSNGRVLPAFGLGAPDSAEHQAFGVERKQRGRWFNEALPLMRRLWTEDNVSHEGPRFTITDVTVRPKPVQTPLEVWLGGQAPLELDRVGRLADGWLPSFQLPAQVAEGRRHIERVAAEHNREVDPEHFGALIPYRTDDGPVTGRLAQVLALRNPEADPAEVVPRRDQLPEAIERFVDVGFSKFVLVPTVEPKVWADELEPVADLVRPLEN
jgi:probable F420-dependent oxidoreductase